MVMEMMDVCCVDEMVRNNMLRLWGFSLTQKCAQLSPSLDE